MKKIVTTILVLIMGVILPALALSSCDMAEDEVSVLYYTYSDTYISSVRTAVDKEWRNRNLGYHNYDANGIQTTQTEQVDTAITKGTKVLVVNVVDTGSLDAAKTIVDKAKAKNIPVIFFNRSVDETIVKSYDKCVFVGTDYEMAGHMQGEMIGNYVKENFSKIDINGDGKISYCLFKGEQGNLEAEARTRYAVEDANKILKDAGLPELSFYDKNNKNGYLLDQNGTWSNAAANNHMKTILSAYSEKSGNMVELVIANNDEMALGAISALNELGYNKEGGKSIPVFGVDATEAAKAKIKAGAMTGTVKQDGEGMAMAIAKITENFILGRSPFEEIGSEMVVDDWRVNIPYSSYTGDGATEE